MKKTLLLLLFSVQIFAQTPVETLLHEADSLIQINKTSHSIKYTLQKVLKQEPRNEEALHKLCEFHINNGSTGYAESYIDTLIVVNPNNALYYWNRVQIKLKEQGLPEVLKQCILDLDKVEELSGKTTNRITRAKFLANYFTGHSIYFLNKGLPNKVGSGFDDPVVNQEKITKLEKANSYFEKAIETYSLMSEEYQKNNTQWLSQCERFLEQSQELLSQVKS